MLVPHTSRAPSLRGVEVARSSTLTSRSAIVRRGLPVARLERAAVDVAVRSPTCAEGVLVESVQRGFTTAVRLRACIFAMGHVAGRRRLLAITYRIEGGDRSVMERRFMRIVREAGLPRPVQNHALLIDDRRLWLDACYPGLRIAIEIDGRAYHLLAEDWEHDLDRQNMLVLDGWLVLRFTSKVICDRPDHVIAQLRAANTSRTALLVPNAG